MISIGHIIETQIQKVTISEKTKPKGRRNKEGNWGEYRGRWGRAGDGGCGCDAEAPIAGA